MVATLLTPIGSQFQASDQASYIGTSYLLSVCCFTPLYGLLNTDYTSCQTDRKLTFHPGRLADIIGRKGAMLIALSLFGMKLTCRFVGYVVMNRSRIWYHILRSGTLNGHVSRCSRCLWNGWRRVSTSLLPRSLRFILIHVIPVS